MTENRFEEGEPRLGDPEPIVDPAGPDGADDRATVEIAPVDDGAESMATPPVDDHLIATPGQFGVVREEKGWSVNDVAGRLRMQVRQIEAIEAGRWQDLPGTAFVRAAIRSYARLLDRDPAPLLASVAQLDTGLDLRSTHRAPVAISPTGSFGETSGIGRWGLALFGLLAVIAIAFYFAPSAELSWPSQWFDGEGGTVIDAGSTIAADRPADGRPAVPDRGSLPSAASPSDDAVAAAARAANELLASQAGAGQSATDAAMPRRDAPDGPSDTASADSTARLQADGGAGSADAAPGVATTTATASQAMTAAIGADAAAGAGGSLATMAGEVAAGEDDARATQAAAVAGATESALPEPAPGPGTTPAGPDAVAAAASALAATTAAASASSLMMSFDAECWVEVSDVRGKRLVYGLQKPHTSLSLDVSGPVSVLVGNADAVTMTRAGEPVDIRSVARDGVARLRLE